MYGETSEFGPIDLLASLAVNMGTTHVACKDAGLRYGIKDKNGEVPAYGDFRFLAGSVAVLASQWVDNAMVRRAAHDTASGLLHSFVATETARRVAETKMKDAGTESAPAPALSDASAEDKSAGRQKSKAPGNANYDYGW